MGFLTGRPKRRVEWLDFRAVRVRVLRRAFQRSLRLQVKSDGQVLVTAGMSLPDGLIERFLSDSWEWVLKCRARVAAAQERQPKFHFRDGESLLYLGSARPLRFVPHASVRSAVKVTDTAVWALVPERSWPEFDPAAAHPEWREPIRRAYARLGKEFLTSRVEAFAAQMGLRPRALSFRCQRTRWGSCSERGLISLNWRLIGAPPAVIDYVVIHELAHLRYGNHSRLFWQLVDQFCRERKSANAWLREHHRALDFLLPENTGVEQNSAATV